MPILVELLGIVMFFLGGCQYGFVAIGSVYCYLVCFVCMHLLRLFVEIVLMLGNLNID